MEPYVKSKKAWCLSGRGKISLVPYQRGWVACPHKLRWTGLLFQSHFFQAVLEVLPADAECPCSF